MLRREDRTYKYTWSAFNAQFTIKLVRCKTDIQVSWSCSSARNNFAM